MHYLEEGLRPSVPEENEMQELCFMDMVERFVETLRSLVCVLR
jgi:hypothetical protein